MNPELKNQLKEDLWNITPEQLKELQQSVQNKIENSKKDLVFDEKEKSELADINQDWNLSITESKIEEHLQKLDDLEKQIDFLLTLVEIKSEATIQEVGTELFNLIIDVASGRKKSWAEQYELHNDLCFFNPAPIT